MSEFLEYCPFDGKSPPTSGAYNIIVFSRGNPGVPVISVAFYDKDKKQWHCQVMSDFGYAEEFRIDDNFISYFKAIEGVDFTVVPESYKITINGVEPNED